MKKLFLLTAFFFTALIAPSLNAQDAGTPQFPAADKPAERQAGWWKQRNDALNKNLKENPCDILFIGDSITQGWEGAGKEVWQQYFAPLNAANFGISGDSTEHVLARMEESKLETPRAPKVCVIMIGTNNTGHHKAKQPAEETAKGIKAIAEKCTKTFPKTRVIVLNIFPRGATAQDPLRIHNEKINSILNKWKAKNIAVISINKEFLQKDGTFKPGLSGDLLHFTKEGYQIWAQALVPHLKKFFPAITKANKIKKDEPVKA